MSESEEAFGGVCECGHPVDRHFAAASSMGLGFGDRMCRANACRCVRSDGRTYKRPISDSERIADLEVLMLGLVSSVPVNAAGVEFRNALMRLRKEYS
jgi:hypothetical protein